LRLCGALSSVASTKDVRAKSSPPQPLTLTSATTFSSSSRALAASPDAVAGTGNVALRALLVDAARRCGWCRLLSVAWRRQSYCTHHQPFFEAAAATMIQRVAASFIADQRVRASAAVRLQAWLRGEFGRHAARRWLRATRRVRIIGTGLTVIAGQQDRLHRLKHLVEGQG
jgi:hypothetical protein